MNELLVDMLQAAGSGLREQFGRAHAIRRKGNLSSIVTEVDVATERRIIERLEAARPDDSVLAEESGFRDRGGEYIWVIDPLDGTSNFVAGLPWFGVMISLLRRGRPVLAGMYLPMEDLFYLAEEGGGTTRNGRPVRVSVATVLDDVLVAYAADACAEESQTRFQADLFGRVLNRARNVRATNSLMDFAGAIDGRLGGVINHATKIWDIAAPCLLLREAGGRLTELSGAELEFSLGADACWRNYAVLGANAVLHAELLRIVVSSGPIPGSRPAPSR